MQFWIKNFKFFSCQEKKINLYQKIRIFRLKTNKKCLKFFKSLPCLNLAIIGQYPKEVLRRDLPPYPSLIFFLKLSLMKNDLVTFFFIISLIWEIRLVLEQRTKEKDSVIVIMPWTYHMSFYTAFFQIK